LRAGCAFRAYDAQPEVSEIEWVLAMLIFENWCRLRRV